MRYDELRAIVRQYDEIRKAGPTGPLFWRLAAIDEAARMACADLAPYVMANVARGVTWEQMRAPCCRNTFYMARARFFGVLNEIMQEVRPRGNAERMG